MELDVRLLSRRGFFMHEFDKYYEVKEHEMRERAYAWEMLEKRE